MQHGAEVFS